MKQLLIEKNIIKLEHQLVKEQKQRIKQYARNELNKIEPKQNYTKPE